MPRSFKRVIVFMLRPQYMQVTNAPDEPGLLRLWAKPEDPEIEPHAGIKMAQGLVSLVYICGNRTLCMGKLDPENPDQT